ncbi:hypothetical protein [Aquimarina intermedia]|uniref:MORN repeat protein n=1 Tax=Aquimarina intermedia TaxID=350814 RepID=A0A5S5CEV9_9FLAO|nr:hypothetical protein [Aquimarina intermedia]TYP77198.1 hypothetical protein BD809_101348 [Aquimarina intermedia]
MRNVTMLILFVFAISMHAQENPKSVKVEETTKTVKVKDNKGTTENKVKTIVKEESEVKMNPADKEKVNQTRIETPATVTETNVVDNDQDNAYDFITKKTYYRHNNIDYTFSPEQKGFNVATKTDSKSVGKAIRSSRPNYYFYDSDRDRGFGYFDKDGNFTVEYYDSSTNEIKMEKYSILK